MKYPHKLISIKLRNSNPILQGNKIKIGMEKLKERIEAEEIEDKVDKGVAHPKDN